MWCAEKWALVLLLSSGCSFVNRIDTCDAPKTTESQVNALTSGDQVTTAAMSVARLASGGYVAVWASRTGTTSSEQTEVRATLLSKDGRQVSPCGSAAGDIAVSVDPSAQIALPVVAAGLTQDAPVYVAWVQQNAGETTRTIQVRLLTQDLCNWATSGPQTVTASEAGEDSLAPTLAVRTDGQQALLAWLASSPGAFTTRLRMRPVGPGGASAAANWLHDNGCDQTPSSCIVNEDRPLGPPVATATALGYALIWSGPRDDGASGWQVRMRAINENGSPGLDTIGKRQFGASERLFLAASANADSLVVAAAIENGSNLNEADRGVYVERLKPGLIDESDPTTVALISIGLDPTQAIARVDPPTGGIPHRPAIHLFDGNQAVVSWISEQAGGVNELRGTVIDEFVAVMFNGLACDVADFAWPTARSKETMSTSLAGDGSAVINVFHSAAPAAGGNDTLGTSVHEVKLDFHPLVPLLK